MRPNVRKKITNSEFRVLQLISFGFTSPEIAIILNRSIRTIDTHRRHLLQKLEANTLPHLMRIAFQNKILSLLENPKWDIPMDIKNAQIIINKKSPI